MPEPSPSPRPWRARVVSVVFVLYAIALILTVHSAAHHLFEGWTARLATIGGIALGLLPWATWLRPRIVRFLGFVGWCVLVGCYFTILVPFAIIARMVGDPLRRRRPTGNSQWLQRRPLPNTLDAARVEY